MNDPWGSDGIVKHAQKWKADVVITLQDIWVLNEENLKKTKNWIPILPVDHDPIPPAIKDRLKHAYRVISYSKFGYKELKKNGIHSTYIPHTVDTSVLKPLPKKQIRKEMSIPDDIFLFGMVGANKDNPPRKSFQQVLDAFAKFHAKHPKSGMYFHSQMMHPKGFQIQEYAHNLGISKDIYTIDNYDLMYGVNRSDMAKIYSMMDCLLMPSTNEGFGVPAIEAQSCGVPAIVTNFTAMPDLIIPGKTGYLCDVAWKRFTPLGSYSGFPDTESIYQNMEKVFKANKKKMFKDCIQFVKKEYDLKVVFEKHWKPFLSKLEKEIRV